MDLKTIYKHYVENPPVIEDRTGRMIRHRGSSMRNSFWNGFDHVRREPSGTQAYAAWRAGFDLSKKKTYLDDLTDAY